jgi:hypothetical protein
VSNDELVEPLLVSILMDEAAAEDIPVCELLASAEEFEVARL